MDHAKRHVDTILELMKWENVFISQDVFEWHASAFADIFINALDEDDRLMLIDHIKSSIFILPHDYQRISANLLFFGRVQ